MGRSKSRWSPQRLAIHSSALAAKRRRDKLKAPYTCPICCQEHAVSLFGQESHRDPSEWGRGTKTFIFACKNGCFTKTIELNSLNYEPIDGYNKVVDELLSSKRKIVVPKILEANCT